MKKIFALLALTLMVVCSSVSVRAQQIPPAPVDQDVRIGTLPNGLKYYIRHNEKPKGQADFYIAQNVGSILEKDNQRGLAHFLEHMCFNGTENFPGNQLVDWLGGIGVRFGQNLNAMTGVETTIYNIANVPVANKAVQDSVLLIIHDWADGLLLEPEEIDKERGVIHQEWRRSNSGEMRQIELLLPKIYPNSPYGERLPIGTMEVVDNFPYQALRDYYEEWYRPDLQAVIVVGDIDVDYIEGKIKEYFSPIKMPENPSERVYFPVEDTEGTIVAIGKDPEVRDASFDFMIKVDPLLPEELKETVVAYQIDFVKGIINRMFANRLSELAQQPDAQYTSPSGSIGNFFLAKTKDALGISASAKGNDIRPAFEQLYRELVRIQRGGFTDSEYERAKDAILNSMENLYNERNNQENNFYVQKYVSNFTDRETMESIEDGYAIMQQLAQVMPLEAVNSLIPQIMAQPGNRVFLTILPDNGEFVIPTEEDILAIIEKVDAEDVQAFVDEVKAEPLIPTLPKPGKVVSQKHNAMWDATELTLSNGVKILVKPTTFKDNQICFEASAIGGGISSIPDAQASDVIMMPYALSRKGLGDYNTTDLRKYLQGKTASLGFSMSDYSRSFSGGTTPKDLKTFMELLYMNFTNVTLPEDSYQTIVQQLSAQLVNASVDPQFVFGVDTYKYFYASPKKQQMTIETVNAANREQIVKLMHNATANAADYQMVFVGAIDMETFIPLVEQYIASLPGNAKKATKTVAWDQAVQVRAGRATKVNTMEMQTPQTYVYLWADAPIQYTAKNRMIAEIVGEVLGKRLLKTVREEWGAVYSIGAQGVMLRQGLDQAVILTSFPMKPEFKDQVLEYIAQEMKNMESDITEEQIAEFKEALVKEAIEDAENNENWAGTMAATYYNGVDIFTNKVDVVKSITAQDCMQYMKEFNKGNYQVSVLEPSNVEAAE